MVRGRGGTGHDLQAGVDETGGNKNTAAIPSHEEPTGIGPQRRCIVTGENGERSAMLRFVITPDGELVPDVAANLPGRGLWLRPRRDLLERAVARRLFARAARRPVCMPAELGDQVEALLARRCCEEIGLARRAGQAVAGFEKVCSALRAGQAALLLAAVDGADGGRGKIRALGGHLPFASMLTAAEMGAVFGRDHVVHVALADGRLSRRLMADAEKLAGFRPGAVVDRGEPAAAGPARHDGIGVR